MVSQKFGGVGFETVFQDSLPDLADELEQAVDIVDRKKCSSQHFARDDQMPEVSPAEVLAGVTGAIFL